jgi:hypothetical protein
VKKVADALTPEKVSLGVSSLRAYGLDENVLDDIAARPRHGRDLRARGRQPADARRHQQERHRRAALETAERVFSRGWSSR